MCIPLAKAIDVLIHPGSIDLASLFTGLGALAILVLLARTPLAMVSALIALVIPAVVVVLAGTDSVAKVGDVGKSRAASRCRTCRCPASVV